MYNSQRDTENGQMFNYVKKNFSLNDQYGIITKPGECSEDSSDTERIRLIKETLHIDVKSEIAEPESTKPEEQQIKKKKRKNKKNKKKS
jgi:hypothetical protein